MNNVLYGVDMDQDYAELIKNEKDNKKKNLLLQERRFKLRCICVRKALQPGDYLYDRKGVKYILQEIAEGGYGDRIYKAVYYKCSTLKPCIIRTVSDAQIVGSARIFRKMQMK